MDHPSGRPVRRPKVGIPQQVRWPRTDFVVPRLNNQRDELPGGFGFSLPPEPDDAMYLETRAKKR